MISSIKNIVYLMMEEIIYNSDACPINPVNELLSRKWVFCIMRDLFVGKHHFNEFKRSNPNLSNVVLSDNLKYLEDIGLIYKKTINDGTKKNTEYHLSENGKKMNRIIYEMLIFGLYVLEDDLRTDEYKDEIKEAFKELLDVE